LIKVKLLSGPYAGRKRKMPAWSEKEIKEFFATLIHHGWRWEVDYSQASEEEKFLWRRADLGARCIWALKEGRKVKFLGKEYAGLEEAGLLEDDIVSSGRLITLVSDNEWGVVLEAKGYEH